MALDQFISHLMGNRIECLIDIRELPISRKKGFAKTALSNRLDKAGINYRHFKALGSPKSHRHRVRETKNYDQFFSAMSRHLSQPDSRDAIEAVIELGNQMRACLMCYCSDWNKCHRSTVVAAIGKRSPMRFSHIVHGETGLQVLHQDEFRDAARIHRAA